jgi:Ca2+-binding EF-hand superfamily protein
MDFVRRMCKVSNRNHNPFRSIISRISFFLKQNNISIGNLLKRLSTASEPQPNLPIFLIPLRVFAEFLKQKVEKKKEIKELEHFTMMLDVDKDGFISEADLVTCIKNLNNAQFYKNGGQALASSTFNTKTKFYPSHSKISKDKALEVCKQIRDALAAKKLQYREVFDMLDRDKDNMVSYAEFSRGLDEIIQLSEPIKEQIYALMDKASIGLINYTQFLDVLRLQNIEK